MSRITRRLAPLLAMAGLLAGGAVAAPPPTGREVSPVLVSPRVKDAPPADVTVQIGSNGDVVRGQDISIWPAAARAAGLGGLVTLNCRIDTHGLAETCRVIFETPLGKGFGGAALALRPTLKVEPRKDADGAPVDADMNIAVRFGAPEYQSNLQDVEQARSPSVGQFASDPAFDVGHHEINGGQVEVAHNPVAMRPVTFLTEPAWAAAPDYQAWASAYPAAGGGVEGYAVAHCRVEKTGVLTRCVVAKELPVSHGFGKAAVALASQFQASPQAMAAAPRGAPIEVDVPIRFPPPAEAKDRVVRAPLWIAGHDPQTLMQAFPVKIRPNSPGAIVKCEVGFDGGLTGCAIEMTSPDGLDFDDAAVKLASGLKMNLWSAEAGPVLGGEVHIPVRADLAVGREAQR